MNIYKGPKKETWIMELFMEGTRFKAGLACKLGYWYKGKNRNFLSVRWNYPAKFVPQEIYFLPFV